MVNIQTDSTEEFSKRQLHPHPVGHKFSSANQRAMCRLCPPCPQTKQKLAEPGITKFNIQLSFEQTNKLE